MRRAVAQDVVGRGGRRSGGRDAGGHGASPRTTTTGHGAWQVTYWLVEVARRSGVRRFVADTLLSNTRMLRLLAEVAPMTTTDVDHGCAHVLVDIPRPRDTTLRCVTG